MIVSKLLALVDDMYPNVATTETKIEFMNLAQSELSPYFGIVVEDSTLVSVADQDSYAYPTGLTDISQIIGVFIENQATPSDRYDYTEYKKRQDYQNPQSANGYYQIINSTGAKKLCLYPAPDTSSLAIIIRYKKALTDLTASNLAASPEFDSRFHDLLAIFCCHMICSIGSSPDAFQADMFMQKFESGKDALWKFQMEQDTKSKHKRRDNPQWHKARSVHIGY